MLPPANFLDQDSLRATQEIFKVFLKHWQVEQIQFDCILSWMFIVFVLQVIWAMNLYFGMPLTVEQKSTIRWTMYVFIAVFLSIIVTAFVLVTVINE